MISIYITLGVLYASKQLFLYYAAMMRLIDARAEGKLSKGQTVVGYILLVEGVVLDVIFHFTIGSLIFLEFPKWKEWTLSARIWRLSNGPAGWRQRLAYRLRTKMLDTLDRRGVHGSD